MAKTVAIGADHGGFDLKEKIIKDLKRMHHEVIDVGTFSSDACDYPEIGYEVAKRVSQKKVSWGILICRSGIGMAMIANKLPGVRAGVCGTVKDAISSREHNDANVLVLAADRITSAKAIDVAKVWLKTKTLGGRHARRVRQMIEYDKQLFKKL